ncbi:hypothetical protein FJZ22_01520 [Candidatus Pacearchaeota archaeon]|nr:hypothetical protein [Candidatus Pacearchaeota archaeon]
MKVEVMITKTRFFVLALLLLVVGVVAYNSNPANPAVFGHSANEIEGLSALGGIPSGAIIMFNMTCPSGWTRFSALDGKTTRGAATYGGTGGSDVHAHDVSVQTTNSDKSWRTPITHVTVLPSSSWPPYLNVIWCKKD